MVRSLEFAGYANVWEEIVSKIQSENGDINGEWKWSDDPDDFFPRYETSTHLVTKVFLPNKKFMLDRFVEW